MIGCPNLKLIEVPVIQQQNGFECGLHVLVNCKYVMAHLQINGTNKLYKFIMQNELKSDYDFHDSYETNLDAKDKLAKENIQSKWKIVRQKSKRITNKEVTKPDEFHIQCYNKFSSLEHSKTDISIESNTISQVNRTTKTTLKSTVNKCSTLPKFKCNIKLLSDSHGRNIRNILNEKLDNNCITTCSMKPNGKVSHILSEIERDSKEMINKDYVVIVAGTNDINPYLSNNCIAQDIKNKIKNVSHTNVIIAAVPYRYDEYSSFNNKIYKVNNSIRKICDEFKFTHYLPLQSFCRNDYTAHGLHFNTFGKHKFSNLIREKIDEITSLNNNSMKITTHITQRNSFLDKAVTGKILQYT